MKQTFLLTFLSMVLFFYGCRKDDSYKSEQPEPDIPSKVSLILTTRVGTIIGQPLTVYVKSLNLLLFRENETGNYVLYRTVSLNKRQLEALEDGEDEAEAGFTALKEFTFDELPLGNYQIVGIGNVIDSTGAVLPQVALKGVMPGNDMSQILVEVADGNQASRLFFGKTETVRAGATGSSPSVLRMFRKVSMFALTLEKIPDVVNQISMDITNTYGSFDMVGAYTPGDDIFVHADNSYTQQVQDSITLTYITLPTVSGDSSTFQSVFYLVDGPKQIVDLPKYFLRPNTITKVTATIDTDQPGNLWKVDINTIITVDVEWNVEQEPPITI